MSKPITPSRLGNLQQKIKTRLVRGCGEQRIAYRAEVLDLFARLAAETALQQLARGELAPEPIVTPPPPPEVPDLPLGMTPELLDVLELVADNMTDQQIARRLKLTVWQVKRRLGQVCTALDVRGRLAAVAAGYELGFLGPAARRARRAAGRSSARRKLLEGGAGPAGGDRAGEAPSDASVTGGA